MAYEGQDKINYEQGNWYLPQLKYSLPYDTPTAEEDQIATGAGIPYTNAFTGGGGNNYTGSTQNLITDFGTAITDRQAKIKDINTPWKPDPIRTDDIQMTGSVSYPAADSTKNWNKLNIDQNIKGAPNWDVSMGVEKKPWKKRISDFLYDKVPGINRPQSYKDIMTKGYQEPGGMVMPGIISLMNKFGIQNFAGLPQSDQAFIKSQTGYTGPTIFGENTGGHNVDPFGKNVESLFGNYAEGVRKDYERLIGAIDKSKARHLKLYGSLDTESKYGKTWAEMNKMNIARFNFRKKQVYDQKDIKSDVGLIDQAKAHKAKQHEAQQQQMEQDRQGGRNPSAGTFEGRSAPGGLSQAESRAARGDPKGTGGGWKWATGGRVGFKYGGIATAL